MNEEFSARLSSFKTAYLSGDTKTCKSYSKDLLIALLGHLLSRKPKTFDKKYTQQSIRRRAARRAEYLSSQGNRCASCGSSEELEVDHIDPAKKTRKAGSIWCLSRQKAEQELKNCQVLCRPCHEVKSLKEQGGSWKHGTAGGYYKHKCRCTSCRAAANAYHRDYKARLG